MFTRDLAFPSWNTLLIELRADLEFGAVVKFVVREHDVTITQVDRNPVTPWNKAGVRKSQADILYFCGELNVISYRVENGNEFALFVVDLDAYPEIAYGFSSLGATETASNLAGLANRQQRILYSDMVNENKFLSPRCVLCARRGWMGGMGALVGLMSDVFLVRKAHLIGRAHLLQSACIQPDGGVTKISNGGNSVCHKNDGATLSLQVFHASHATLLKLDVPNSQSFIDDQDVRLHIHGHCKRQSNKHPAGINANRLVYKLTYIREGGDVIKAYLHFRLFYS
jgi:hypothetical protein